MPAGMREFALTCRTQTGSLRAFSQPNEKVCAAYWENVGKDLLWRAYREVKSKGGTISWRGLNLDPSAMGARDAAHGGKS